MSRGRRRARCRRRTDAQLHRAGSQDGVVRGEADVAGEREFTAAAEREAVDGRDDRLGAALDEFDDHTGRSARCLGGGGTERCSSPMVAREMNAFRPRP